MANHDALLAYRFGNLLQLLWTLGVPAGGDGLQDEAGLLEVLYLSALPYFVCGEAVAVCGERLLDGRVCVWGVEPCL